MQIVYPMGNTFVKGGSRGQVKKGEGVPLTLPPRFARAPSLSPRWGRGAGGVGVISFPLLSALLALFWLKIGSLGDFLLPTERAGGKVEVGKEARPPRVRRPPANGQSSRFWRTERGGSVLRRGKDALPPTPVGVRPPPKTPASPQNCRLWHRLLASGGRWRG